MIVAAFGWTRPAWAPGCPSCRTTSLLVRLSGTIFIPPDPCVASGEKVSLIGDVHAVTIVGSNRLFDLYLNMAGVDGVGQVSGSRYVGTGSNKFLSIQWPPGSVSPDPIVALFALEKTNGCASVPLPV